MKKWYHKGNERIKLEEGQDIPEGFIQGWGPRGTSWNKGLTAENDERVKLNGQRTKESRLKNNSYQAWNKGLTKETDPRIKGLPGVLNPMYGKHRGAWNKGLSKNTDERMKKVSQTRKGQQAWNKGLTKETDIRMKKISELHMTEEMKSKKFKTMLEHDNLNSYNSKAEKDEYKLLLQSFNPEDIISQYYNEEKYPFKCDFYIRTTDTYVEVNGNWTHGSHPFDKNKEEDIKKLNEWIEKSKTSKYYKNAIYTWTDLDVRKLNIAIQNKLNYIVIYKNKIVKLIGGTLVK